MSGDQPQKPVQVDHPTAGEGCASAVIAGDDVQSAITKSLREINQAVAREPVPPRILAAIEAFRSRTQDAKDRRSSGPVSPGVTAPAHDNLPDA